VLGWDAEARDVRKTAESPEAIRRLWPVKAPPGDATRQSYYRARYSAFGHA
jgi:hypothetical protein